MTTTPTRAVIFDMDGVLLDTETLYTEATQQIVARFGKTFDWRIKADLIGRPAMESARHLVDALQLPMRPEDYLAERDAILHTRFAECDAMPGAEKLVRHLHAHQVPIAVATSSSRALFAVKSGGHSWFRLFNAVVCADDAEVKRGKPAPDIFLAAAGRLGVAPAAALVFEDAPAGLQAGLAAGMRVVAVPDAAMDKTRYAGAEEVLAGFAEFVPGKYGLPRWSGG